MAIGMTLSTIQNAELYPSAAILVAFIGARVVELDGLCKDRVGLGGDHRDLLRYGLTGLMRNPADALAATAPRRPGRPSCICPRRATSSEDRAFFGRRNQRLVGLAVPGDGARVCRPAACRWPPSSSSVSAITCSAKRDPEQIDIRCGVRRAPARSAASSSAISTRVGVDRLHATDRQQAKPGHRDEHERNHRDNLGPDGQLRHDWLLCN